MIPTKKSGIFSTVSSFREQAIACNCCLSSSTIQEILKEIEELLATAGDLVPEAELAVEKLLNIVEALNAEALNSEKQSLADEVQWLKGQLEQKKRGKNTDKGSEPGSNHSSEIRQGKHRSKNLLLAVEKIQQKFPKFERSRRRFMRVASRQLRFYDRQRRNILSIGQKGLAFSLDPFLLWQKKAENST